MRLLLLDAAAGIGLLATITLSARRASQKRSRHVRALGWMLVAGPLPLAVALHAAGRLPPTTDQVVFLSAVAAFAIGAALVLSVDDEEDQRGDADDDPPPWWPDFEREFQEYARSCPARRGRPFVRT
jgi:hypothetical protein